MNSLLVGSYLTLNHYTQLFGTLINAYHMWHNVPSNWDSVYVHNLVGNYLTLNHYTPCAHYSYCISHVSLIIECMWRDSVYVHNLVGSYLILNHYTWLISLPIDDHGFASHKCAFRDALFLQYGWSLQNPPSYCTCSHPFSIEYALTCKTGGFPAIQHNEVRDIIAFLLYSQKSVMEWQLNHTFSHSQEKSCLATQLSQMMEPALIFTRQKFEFPTCRKCVG